MSTELEVTESSEVIGQIVSHLSESNLVGRWGKFTQVTLQPNPDGIDNDSPVWYELWSMVKHHYSDIYYELDNQYYNARRYTDSVDSELVEKRDKASQVYHKVSEVSLSSIIDSVGGELVNSRGKFAKRFMREFKQLSTLELPNAIVSKIGNMITESTVKESESFYVDVTNDFNWDDGDFGHSGSCWFDPDQYPTSLDSLLGVNGYAMRLFTANGRDDGRVWIIPSVIDGNEVFILFNAYGFDGVSQCGHILRQLIKDVTGVDYQSTMCEFESNYSSSAMYINPDKRIVYPSTMQVSRGDDFVMKIRKIEGDHFDRIMENQEESYYCESCEDRLSENEGISHNGSLYCESCFNDLFTSCYHCGDYIDNEDIISSESGYEYCESCYTEIYVQCESCNSETHTNDAIELDDGCLYCEDCANDRTYACDDCQERVDHTEIHMTHDNQYGYCDSCFENHSFTCKSCQRQLDDSELAIDETSTHFINRMSTESYLDNTQDYNPLMLCKSCFTNRPVITSAQMKLFEVA